MKTGLAALMFLILPFCIVAQPKNLADYINPFIGASTNTQFAGAAHGLGKTFPRAVTPFGMVQVNPNTITGGDIGQGYSFEHTTIEGFAFTQMSGIGWLGDLGNFLVMPITGVLHSSSGRIDRPEEGYRSRYSMRLQLRLIHGIILAKNSLLKPSITLREIFIFNVLHPTIRQ